MNRAEALQEIQRMHEHRTVRPESIVAWYRFYSNKLPRMYPERSDVDLIRTAALWMELTDRGGSPGFPFDYRSELNFSTVGPTRTPRGNRFWVFGVSVMIAGLVTLFFAWKIAIVMLVAGVIIHYLGYRLSGGPANPDLMTEGTTLYEQEGRRVMEWAMERRAPSSPHIEMETH